MGLMAYSCAAGAHEPLMVEPSPRSGAEAAEADVPRLSWREKELVAALKRLAGAQSQVALLEERLAAQARATVPDPDDARRLEQLEAELVKLRHKANSRFGGASALDRLAELDMQQRLVLDRLGFAERRGLRRGSGLARRAGRAGRPRVRRVRPVAKPSRPRPPTSRS